MSPRYQVTRTWEVVADSPHEALEAADLSVAARLEPGYSVSIRELEPGEHVSTATWTSVPGQA